MRRLVATVCIALLAVFVAASVVKADTRETRDPNIERLGDPSAKERAAAARTLGNQ